MYYVCILKCSMFFYLMLSSQYIWRTKDMALSLFWIWFLESLGTTCLLGAFPSVVPRLVNHYSVFILRKHYLKPKHQHNKYMPNSWGKILPFFKFFICNQKVGKWMVFKYFQAQSKESNEWKRGSIFPPSRQFPRCTLGMLFYEISTFVKIHTYCT